MHIPLDYNPVSNTISGNTNKNQIGNHSITIAALSPSNRTYLKKIYLKVKKDNNFKNLKELYLTFRGSKGSIITFICHIFYSHCKLKQ